MHDMVLINISLSRRQRLWIELCVIICPPSVERSDWSGVNWRREMNLSFSSELLELNCWRKARSWQLLVWIHRRGRPICHTLTENTRSVHLRVSVRIWGCRKLFCWFAADITRSSRSKSQSYRETKSRPQWSRKEREKRRVQKTEVMMKKVVTRAFEIFTEQILEKSTR